ncbi:DUF4339 domain-containing protein [Bacteriovoracaceae bacterium]|nr:DUF4339 domain-containing protein [Bacteriovoracaceae bacterium]
MKKWFIIEEDNHLGPFSARNLVNLFNKKKIFEETQIWCEELVEPTSYREEFINKMNEVLVEMNKEDQPGIPIIKTLPPDLPDLDFPTSTEDKMTMITIDKDLQELDLELEQKLSDQTEIIPPPPVDIPSAEDLEAKKIISQLKRTEREKNKKAKSNTIDENQSFDGIDERKIKEKLIEEDLRDQPPPRVEELSVKELRNLYQDETKEERHSRLKKLWIKRLTLASMPFLGFVTYLIFEYVSLYHVPFSRPQKMSSDQYTQATKFLEKSKKLNAYRFFMSTDRDEIYMITPNKAKGQILVEFNLIKNESLADTNVAFEATGNLEQNILTLNRFEFNQGKNIEDGFYEIRIRSMEKLKTAFVSKYIASYPKHLDHFEKFLISGLTEQDFKLKLTTKKKKRERNQSGFFKELLQKYLTLKMMTTQIIGQADAIFNGITDDEVKDKAIAFENVYKNQFGNFFTSFVITNNASFEKIKGKQFKRKKYVFSEYKRLSDLARKMGEESMNFLGKMEDFDKVKHGDFNLYYQTSMKPLIDLKNEFQSKEEEIRTIFDL